MTPENITSEVKLPENKSHSTSPSSSITIEQGREVISLIIQEIKKVIIGQDNLIRKMLLALLADGHVLLEGVPGVAKTKICNALTNVISAKMNRIQFTPDLLPSDLIGTEVYKPQTGEFFVRKGPIFTNLLLADEINRAPSKVQSALLEAMQEKQVTIGEDSFKLPYPFLVLATQNPIEQEGTYSLPEAQLDRFLMKLIVTYPTFEEELKVVNTSTSFDRDLSGLKRIINIQDLFILKELATSVYTDSKIERYIVSLIHATRKPEDYGLKGRIDWGASPRASIALKICSKCLALMNGRNYVTHDDVKELAPDVLRHRIIISYLSESNGETSDEIIKKLLNTVPL